MKKLIIALTTLLLLTSCGNRTAPVNYKIWYNWPERFLPDFSTLGEPDVQGVKRNLDLLDIVDTINHYAALFETTLKVGKTEEYTFNVTTDDGSRFYIDGELMIENDRSSAPRPWKRAGTSSGWSSSTTTNCRRWSSFTPPQPSRSAGSTTI